MRGSSRLLSGLAAAAFALLIVGLGGWWFTLSLGVIVHLALLEFFRLAQFKGIRPASKTTLVACQLLLIITQLAPGSPWAAAVLPVAGSVICGWAAAAGDRHDRRHRRVDFWAVLSGLSAQSLGAVAGSQ